MLSRLSKTLGAALLLCAMNAFSQTVPLASRQTAKLTVNGAEMSINGVWDNGPTTIDFNGFVETVNYGQFSTPASLASGLAAMFTRDYVALGLYAKAGANNNQDPAVITFQLATGAAFGPINIVGSTVSFSYTPAGFGSSMPTADRGVATLSLNGAAIATSNYGDGSTGASIAQDLALNARSALVGVRSDGSNLFLESKQTTGSFAYSYNLSFSTSPSFSSSPSSGALSSSTVLSPVNVYNYVASYDWNSNVNGIADSVMGTWAYGYDGLNRLVSGQTAPDGGGAYAGQYICWSYDNFGNRTHQSISNQPFINGVGQPCQLASGASLVDTAVNYSANNQISSVTSPALTVAYDAAGNTTSDGYNRYTYDPEGRVCAANGPNGMTGYQYDADGNRIGKGTVSNWQSCDITSNGYIPTTDFVLDQGGGQVSEVSVGGGTQLWQHTNVTANGILFATFNASGLHIHLNDALGSRRFQTDPVGIPEQACQSLPFGDQLYCTGSIESPTEHHFTGKERDAESGLDYFGARYYASNMGRFMSPDTPLIDQNANDPQSWNLYSYVRNNPLTNTDPTGNACVGNVDDDRGGETCAQVDAADAEYARQGRASVTVTAQPSGGFEPGSLAYNTFGPPSAAIYRNAAGVVNAAGTIAVTIMAPYAGALVDCMSGGTKAGCAANMAISILPEVGELRAGAKLLKAGRGLAAAEILERTGGFAQATKDFEALNGAEKTLGNVKVKELSDGSKAVLRNFSGDGRPTLEIQNATGTTKFRYN